MLNQNTIEFKNNFDLFVSEVTIIPIDCSIVFYNIQVNSFYKHYYYEALPSTKKSIVGPSSSPSYVLAWEKIAKHYYHTSLECWHCLKDKNIDKINKEIILDYCKKSHAFIANLHTWRPSKFFDIQSGDWDKNNWSNGYFCGAFSIFSKILNIDSYDILYEKGLNWLKIIDDKDKSFLPHTHWINRSTNHGLVIYASTLVGLLILEMHESRIFKELNSEMQKTIFLAYEDGSYIESVSYSNFVVSELVPFFYFYRKLVGDRVIYDEFKALKKISYLYKYALTPNNTLFANYGDCEKDIKFPKLISNFCNYFGGNFTSDIESPAVLLEDMSNDLLNSNCIPEVHLDYDSYIEKRVFSKNHFVGLKLYRNDHVYSIWGSGSKLHKTHNKNNDFASIFLAKDNNLVIVSNGGVNQSNHSIPVVMKNDKVISSMNGRKSVPRNFSSPIKERDNEDYLKYSISAKKFYLIENQASIDSLVRNIILPKLNFFIIIIVDSYKAINNNEVVSQFLINSDLEIKGNIISEGGRTVLSFANDSGSTSNTTENKIFTKCLNISNKSRNVTIFFDNNDLTDSDINCFILDDSLCFMIKSLGIYKSYPLDK